MFTLRFGNTVFIGYTYAFCNSKQGMMCRDLHINTPPHRSIECSYSVWKPRDGHYWPKHVVSLLEYNIFLNKLYYLTTLPPPIRPFEKSRRRRKPRVPHEHLPAIGKFAAEGQEDTNICSIEN